MNKQLLNFGTRVARDVIEQTTQVWFATRSKPMPAWLRGGLAAGLASIVLPTDGGGAAAAARQFMTAAVREKSVEFLRDTFGF